MPIFSGCLSYPELRLTCEGVEVAWFTRVFVVEGWVFWRRVPRLLLCRLFYLGGHFST